MRRKASLFVGIGLASLLTLGLEGIVSRADARIIRVSSDYPTLQSAINAAAPSDTILVSDAVLGWSENPIYREYPPIVINGQTQAHGGNLTIMSEHGRDYTEIENWNGAPAVLQIQGVGSGVRVQGFSIDGQYSPFTVSGAFIGIDIRDASPVISECAVFGSETCIYSLDSSPVVEDSNIRTDVLGGRGIRTTNYSTPDVLRNTFTVGSSLLSSFTSTNPDTIIHYAEDPTSSGDLEGNSYDGGGGALATHIPVIAIRLYGSSDISALTETIIDYQTEIESLRTYGSPEQQAAYNCPAIIDRHDNPILGFVDLFGVSTSIPTENPYSQPSTLGRLKIEYQPRK